MVSTQRRWAGITMAAVAIAVMGSVSAEQAQTARVPTKKDPIRFTAFAVQMNAGASGVVEIAIERWTTDTERTAILALVNTATDKTGGQDKLLKALQNIKVRTGFIRTPNSLGWDLKYAYEAQLPDGTRQIVIGTDKPVSFLAAASDSQSMDYPFSLVQMHFPQGSEKGEGKLLARTSVSTKDGRLQLELYGTEATRLTEITEEKDKAKGK